ncbi:MAG: restriction endonuclease [Flavobacteriales bacterium]|nr:restriction endonuclease [Flavobacteriales bacterium]
MKGKLFVSKSTGFKDVYKPEKLRVSLLRSGANKDIVNDIVKEINELVYEDIPTQQIYKKAYSLLKRRSRISASKYGLKKAVLELGPTGYPFEQLVSQVLKAEGFEVKVGETVQGHCVSHEVDVLASKENINYLVECKYHSEPSRFSNVKIPLYIQSRFEDIDRLWKLNGNSEIYRQGWIYTNTRFSEDALAYGNCMGLKLISWKYPAKGNLESRIRLNGLFPVTCLNELTISEKQRLIEKKIVTAIELKNRKEILSKIGINSPSKIKRVLSEIDALCNQL